MGPLDMLRDLTGGREPVLARRAPLSTLRRFALNRIRLGAAALAMAAAAMGLVIRAPQALAAAEVHRLNLVLSAVPTSIDGGDFNKDLELFNTIHLDANGLEPLNKIGFGWMFDAEMRYFVRPNVAVAVGMGQLKVDTKKEYLPALQQSLDLTGEVLSVPVNVGAAYYLQPYNQGDFQARLYVGAGVSSLVYNRVTFQSVSNITDTGSAVGQDQLLHQSYKLVEVRDAPGYYAEVGVHMFFAARYSVMIAGRYRSAKINGMIDQVNRQPYTSTASGEPFELDMSGVGVRGAVAFGF